MGPSCDGDNEVATKHAELSSDASAGGGSEDRLSALPDDILVLILLKLSTLEAAQTSVLSRRWRRVWALLPELHFYLSPEPRQIGPAIQAHEAAIECLVVITRDAGAESVAAWLPVAARRLYGTLVFQNQNLEREGSTQESDDEEGLGQTGAFELTCLERAANVILQLGFLGLAMPPAGVFSRLTRFFLADVRLHGPELLGDAVSWPRCLCLQELTVRRASGLDKLAIHSNSLRQVELTVVQGLQQLNIVAPALEKLEDIDDYGYMMEDMTMLPDITTLQLNVLANGHAFVASAFHVLRMCSSIEKLMLAFVAPTEVEAQNMCPPGCVCREHQNWETEHLLLNRLKEVEVTQMGRSGHEVTFVKHLFYWATSLEKMRVVFDMSVTESVAKELSQELRSFARPGIRMEVRTYMEDILKINAPED